MGAQKVVQLTADESAFWALNGELQKMMLTLRVTDEPQAWASAWAQLMAKTAPAGAWSMCDQRNLRLHYQLRAALRVKMEGGGIGDARRELYGTSEPQGPLAWPSPDVRSDL